MVTPPGPELVFSLITGMSVVTFAVYGFDKRAARQGDQRVSERALHMLALAGGWPGALVGQRVFGHKTRKQPFRTVFWATLVPPLALVIWTLF